jgi:hypothetical protein
VETFVVRVFVPADLESIELCGLFEHVGSGRVESFRGRADLVDRFLTTLESRGVEETASPNEGFDLKEAT